MDSDPVSVAERFFRLVDEVDLERQRELVHPEGPLGEFPPLDEQRMQEGFADATLELESATVVEREEDTATVRVAARGGGVGFGEELDGGGETDVAVRRTEDGWLIWNVQKAR